MYGSWCIFSLEDEGFEIYEAHDGNEAISKAKSLRPDLMMPGKTGYEVCEKLKSNPDTQGIYILWGGSLSEMTGKRTGGDAFMVKPFEPAELRETVKKALGIG